ncbi:hypothetical protein MNBD_GAMMA16-1683 [hydrothermal vent metagenome]|uniref:DUF4303 domain-containing protein n=1 Tax=hydrothermal vent metagenome TaxID=652676 RepID=A0A3B0ZF35_9ZZZZ
MVYILLNYWEDNNFLKALEHTKAENMTEKNKFIESSYHKFKNAITEINDDATKDIYAVSFWYFEEDDDLRFPTILVSYNTNANYKEQILKASNNKEAKWNYAYWLQDFIGQIGGREDELLKNWFKSTPYFYSENENEKMFENNEIFEKIIEQGSEFCEDFIEEIILLTKRLFSEKVILNKFGKNIPILVHELEYGDGSTDLTLNSNPKGVADEFIEWVQNPRQIL